MGQQKKRRDSRNRKWKYRKHKGRPDYQNKTGTGKTSPIMTPGLFLPPAGLKPPGLSEHFVIHCRGSSTVSHVAPRRGRCAATDSYCQQENIFSPLSGGKWAIEGVFEGQEWEGNDESSTSASFQSVFILSLYCVDCGSMTVVRDHSWAVKLPSSTFNILRVFKYFVFHLKYDVFLAEFSY